MQGLKKELRARLLAERRAMEEKDRQFSDKRIYNKLIDMHELIAAETVLTYASSPTEVDTRALIDAMLAAGKTVAVPRCVGKEMRFYAITSQRDLKPSRFGVDEPLDDIDDEVTDFANAVCITPALMFSRDGFRLGYGGGFYDRFLSKAPCVSIGLCYDRFIGEVPVDSHDIRVNHIVTESEIITVRI